MRYCKKCVMPDTRPGITFNEQGICSACQSYENRKNVDWEKRFQELQALCDKYRGMNGSSYDCAIAVSGGKDSHFQVYFMKEVMKMNPILFTVEDNFPMTEAGKHNIRNISEEFGCHLISLKPDIKTQKILMRYMFEKYGKANWYLDRLIYIYPLQMALAFHTPLLVYGENVSYEYGGSDYGETYSAKGQLRNGVASDVPMEELEAALAAADPENWQSMKASLAMAEALAEEQIESLDPIYLSYFVQWNSYGNYMFAKSRGFHDLTGEWERTHMAEQFDQVDSRAYLVHPWMKYPKFGHASATDYAARFVRYGLMTREEAVEVVKARDSALDPACVRDFCEFTGYTESEFWKIMDKWYNRDLFEKDPLGVWRLRHPVWAE